MKLLRFACFQLALLSLVATQAAAYTNTAMQPVPREADWLKRHEEFLAVAKKGGIDLLFLGDSITDYWRTAVDVHGVARGKPVWDKAFAPLHAANFGISGDRTQHVLWRIDHGELDGLSPKLIVLMIGTNNLGVEKNGAPRNTAAETIRGVAAVVRQIRLKLPATKILLLGIFPRNHLATDPVRLQLNEVNATLTRLNDGRFIRYLDIGPKFLAADGSLSTKIMPDLLHPNTKGYQIWADAIKQPVAEMMK